jgi:DNA-binding transcriptional MocR family regulator
MDSNGGPVYLTVVNQLAADLQAGRLGPGDRLPTQRDLAEALGVAVTTVTRAYREAERRGLVTGEVGRGTFVRAPAFAPPLGRGGPAIVDLSINSMLPHAHAGGMLQTIASLAAHGDPEFLLNYQPAAGHVDSRAAGVEWLRAAGVPCEPGEVLLTAGAQNAMAAALGALLNPGETLLVEEVTYNGVRALAAHLHVHLQGVAMDDEGLDLVALEAAVRQTRARVVYCMPSLQNPTGRLMSARRRAALADLGARLDLIFIEDDTYGFLVPEVPPLVQFAPDRTCYIASLSKSLAPGLRVGYLRAPRGWVDRVSMGVFATTVTATPLMAAAAATWISNGQAADILAWKREEVLARGRLARRVLGEPRVGGHALSPHVWVEVPASWSPDDLVEEAEGRGVRISAGRDFAVDRRAAPGAVRICLGPPHDRRVLDTALGTVAELLARSPRARETMI